MAAKLEKEWAERGIVSESYNSVQTKIFTPVEDLEGLRRGEYRHTREIQGRVAYIPPSPPSHHKLSIHHTFCTVHTPLVNVFLAILGHTTRHNIFLVNSVLYF